LSNRPKYTFVYHRINIVVNPVVPSKATRAAVAARRTGGVDKMFRDDIITIDGKCYLSTLAAAQHAGLIQRGDRHPAGTRPDIRMSRGTGWLIEEGSLEVNTANRRFRTKRGRPSKNRMER
jgi:hypothetical protein